LAGDGYDSIVNDAGWQREFPLHQACCWIGSLPPTFYPFEIAAAYLFHLANNPPFVDRTKRTGTVASLVFLDWNKENPVWQVILGLLAR